MRFLPEMFSDDTKYAFAVGKIKVLETRLLSRTELQRMLEAPSAQDALAVLMDSPYEQFLSNIGSPLEFEEALNAELERSYRMIDSLSQDKGLTDIFRIKWDYHNLKVLLKASYLEPGVEEAALVPLGLVEVDLMRSALAEEERTNVLPDYLEETLLEAKAEYEESQDPQMIDVVVERRMFEDLLERASVYPNRFLAGYLRTYIDLNNIRNLVRLKAMNGSARLLEKILVEGGAIPKSRYFRMLDESIAEIPSLLRGTPYSDVIGSGIQEFVETGALTAFEKLMDDYLIDYIRPAKYVAFGIEPLIAYLIAKEHEIKLIRIIMIGKINQLSMDAISDRLREPYV
jgi:V/A-type H+-transporting ATPase subunit C